MNRILVLSLLAVGACGGAGPVIDARKGDLVIANAPIDDIGTYPVGLPSFIKVRLSALRASVPVTAADVENPDGAEKVFFTISEFLDIVPDAELPEGFTAVTGTVNVPVNGEIDYPLVYWPQAIGYDRASIGFTFAGIEDVRPKKTELRARAALPAASIYPTLVDCGYVPVGQTRKVDITVENRSALPLVMSWRIDGTLFSSLEPNPFSVPAESAPYAFTVDCTPLNELPATSAVRFSIGDVGAAVVTLRMNDCENGVPAAYDKDEDGYSTCGGDCDDENAQVNPSKTEVPDGADNDCNGKVDDTTRGYDDDGDGFCEHPTACSTSGVFPGDCNDGDERMNPDEVEDCPGPSAACTDGIDNDCDGSVDGGSDDGDGDGYSTFAGDCDDTNASIYPFAPELPNTVDDNCNSVSDEGTRLFDDDGDGYCEGIVGTTGCTVGLGTGDCDDRASTTGGTNPGAAAWPDATGANELPDRIDNDCDGKVDEGTRYDDIDKDGYTEAAGDCAPDNAAVGPHKLEIGNNGIDDDCDGATPVTGPR